jgi:hypothetical protein
MNIFDAVVQRTMKKFTGKATILIQGVGVYDDDTGTYTTSDSSYEVNCLVFDKTLQSNGTQTDKNTLIQAGDKQVFIQPVEKDKDVNPLPRIKPERDSILLSGVKYGIVTFKEINPSQSDCILIELYVRK